MKTGIDKKIVSFLVVLALCAALTRPILAYMGGELPELPEGAGMEADYCATSGICVISGGSGDESIVLLSESSVDGNTLRLVCSGNGWSCKDWPRHDSEYESLDELMYEILGEYGDLAGFDSAVIDAETHLDEYDWFSILLLGDSMPNITSLTVNGLTHVEESAFAYEGSWLESVSLPDARSVGERAFMGCDSLVSVSLPKAESIGSRAFYNTGLQKLYLEDIGGIKPGESMVSPYTEDNPLKVYYTSGDWELSDFVAELGKQARYVKPEKLGNTGESSQNSEDSSSESSKPEDSSSESSEPEDSSSESSKPEDSSSESSEPEDSSSESSEPEDSSSESSEPEDSSSESSGPEDSSSESSKPEGSSSESSEPEDSSSESSEPDDSSSESSEPEDSSSESSGPEDSSSESSEREDASSESSKPEDSSSEASSSQASSKPASNEPTKSVRTILSAVNSEEITQAVQAIAEAAANDNAAVENGGNSVKPSMILRFQNKSYISLANLREITRASDKAGVKVTVHADTKVGSTVVNRLYIDPAKASKGIRLMTGEGATSVLRRFELYTENTLAVLSLDQQDNFGMKVGVAFKLPLPAGADVKKLAIYSFDPETGKYRRIFVPHKRVEPGYLWLETDRAGFIVVSNGTLRRSR